MAAGAQTGGRMKWFAAMTTPRGEELANRNLKRLGYHTFYPFERVRRLRKRANLDKHVVEWITKPYFPGYLFLCIREGEGLYQANEADGVSTIVHSNGAPLEIPHTVMDEIMAFTQRDGLVGSVDTVSRKPYQVGQMVKFQDNSPMSGLLAKISVDNGKEVRVWIKLLGSNRQISVDPSVVAIA
jgi:transcription antitermination factor NusG